MPHIEIGASGESDAVLQDDLGYTYPMGLDLRPTSNLHRRLKTRIMERARASHEKLKDRYKEWEKLDNTLTAYIPLDAEEEDLKENDSRRPVSIVVPLSYLNLEVILTYMVSTFLDDEIIEYSGASPEDVLGAILLTKVVDGHMQRSGGGLALHTQLRDAFVYGMGVLTPTWERMTGRRSVEVPETLDDGFGNLIQTGNMMSEMQDFLRYEGSELQNIEPYLYMPDPNVPVHRIQKMEFVSWLQEDSFVNLMKRERDSTDFLFNVKYLRNMSTSRSTLRGNESGRKNKTSTNEKGPRKADGTRPFDILIMYIDLIPEEWGLGSNPYPEKWLFMLAADSVIIAARPAALQHDMFPVTVMAPDYDGYSVAPISRVEIGYPAQQIADFMLNSHVANVRKALNDMLVVDPSVIDMDDVLNPGPGKIIRKRPNAWSKSIGDAIQQLAVGDVTQSHIKDLAIISDLMQRTLGASDALQGVIRDQGERVSATESRDARIGAVSRLQKAAKIIGMQAMQPLGMLLGHQTQQFMENNTWVSVLGRWEEVLRMDLGIPPNLNLAQVNPADIMNLNFDVMPHDGSMPGGEFSEALVQMMQVGAQNPWVAQRLDHFRLFKHVMRGMGVKNVDDFEIRPVATTVMDDEQVAAQAQAGNIRPMIANG